MFLTVILMQTNNLLLGVMPESLGLFVFGLGLIAFAISLRWFFGKRDEQGGNDLDKTVS
jgi:hypothetical protein